MPAVTPAAASKKIALPDLGGAFSMPVVSPELVPPPYRYKDTRAVNMVFRTDPRLLEQAVPAPLQPNPNGLMIFYIGLFQFADWDLPYHEAGLVVPVLHEGRAGNYAVLLYLDQPNPIVGGREIYGWPKKDAGEILYHEGDRVAGSVTRYGQRIIEASFEPQQQLDPIPDHPKDPNITLKYMPSAEKGAPPDVLKLISTLNDPDTYTKMRIGKGTLRFNGAPDDAFLARVPIHEVVYAEEVAHDFTMGYGKVLVDYLAQG